ncbi:MAG: EpsG family protein [Lachnospiraceae bacterium]|nr:EpsG family protein [Lachnospiraceae bacterium]
MANNWAFIIWVGIMTLLCNICSGKRRELVHGKYEWRTAWFWAILIFIPITICSAQRGTWEGDTGTYSLMFQEIPSDLSAISDVMVSAQRDKGYPLLELVIKSMGGTFRQMVIAIAIFVSFAVVLTYRKYSCSYPLSVFLFVAGFEYYQWMFNGMRQFMAVSILLLCTPAIIEKKYKKLFLPLFIASTLHMSVLIVVPCLLITHGIALNKRVGVFIVVIVFVVFTLAQTGTLNDVIMDLMSETQYDSITDEFVETMDSGTSIMRVLVYSVPVLLALVGLKLIRAENDPIINFCVNMSAVSMGIYVVSMFTSAILIGRLPIYFSIYNYILLPWEVNHIFEKQSARIVMFSLIAFYLAYNYYQVAVAYGQSFNFGFLTLG